MKNVTETRFKEEFVGVSLYEFTNANRERILERTISLVAQHTHDASRDELTGALPQVLDDVVAALAGDIFAPDDSLHESPTNAAARQGVMRFLSGFELKTVVRCFGGICDSITALAETERLAFDAHEFRLLNQSIDTCVADAVEAFTDRIRRNDRMAATARIGSLAHELRNALATVTFGFELMQTGAKTGHLIERSLMRMDTLISQTLAASKLHEDPHIEVAPQGLQTMIREIVEMIPPTEVGVHVHIQDDATIEADRTLMVSAIGNLVQNAVKFTPAGGTVTVRAAVREHEAIIEVEDECGGLGVPDPEVLFAPFHQSDSSRGGAGLGLAIVRDAVKAHGGAVEVHDQPPRGCRFILRWPLHPR